MTIAACLIVKNEGEVIARCLNSVAHLVQIVVIVDTGSTDDTLDVIRALDYPVPIHIYQRPWQDFAHNRTESLQFAASVADYLLLLDADYTVEGELPELTADAYYLKVRTPSIEYPKLLLVRASLPWRYEGVVHEYLVCEQAGPPGYLNTPVIRDHVDGGRRPAGWQPRWEWDAEVLEKELARDPSNTRNVFYLARSYDDLSTTRPNDPKAGEWRQKAQARYRERSQMAGYADEAFYSLLRLGVMRLAEGDGLTILLEAWQRCPQRWEPVHEAARWLNQRRLFEASYALSKRALAKPVAPSGLFVSPAVFDYLLLFEHSISAYWIGNYQESWDACQTLLGKQLPGSLMETVRSNMAFARQRLDERGNGTVVTVTRPIRPHAQEFKSVPKGTDPLVALLQPSRLTAVVSIGANPIDGEPIYKPMHVKGLCSVVGFEPQAEALALLKERQGPRETYLPYAVGDGTQQTLHICQSSGMTSLFKPDQRTLDVLPLFSGFGKVVATEPIRTYPLDAMAEITALDFLQIDVQGSELSVFQSGRNKLAEAIAIHTEVSFLTLYEKQPIFGLIDQELRAQGFVPHAFSNIKRWALAPMLVNNNPRQGLNQLLEADIVYVRDFTRPEGFTDEQLKQLALIAHHCYGSFDLALRCILILEQRGRLEKGCQQRYLQLVTAEHPTLPPLGIIGQ